MQLLIDFFDVKDLMPHGYCLSWSSLLLWLHVVSDLLITLCYYSIPLSLIYFVRQRKDLPYPWLIAMFALFIVACGTTHLLSIATIWIPLYWLEGYVKAFTAVISIATALAMFWIIPLVLKLPSPTQLQAEIAHRKLIDKAHQEALERLQKIASSLPGMVYKFRLSVDGHASIPYCSEGVLDIFRLNPEQVYEDSSKLFALIHPDDYTSTINSIQHSAQHLTTWLCEFRVCFENGTERWLLGNALPQREADGSTLWHGFITDITDRKSVDNEILAARNQLQATLDAIPDLLFEVDAEGRYYNYHAPHSELLLTSHDSFLGKKLTDILPADAADVCLSALQEAQQQGWSIGKQLKLTQPQGDFWFELSVSIKHIESTENPHFIVLSRDITERKRIEESLYISEQRHTLILNQSELGTWDWDIKSGQVIFNEHWAKTRGYILAEITPYINSWKQSIHPDDLPRLQALLEEHFANKIAFFEVEYRIQHRSGQWLWLLNRGAVCERDAKGHPLRMVGTEMDITERKLAETELRIAATAFESQEGMVITDTRNIILRVNAAFTRVTGYTAEESVGCKISMLKSGRHDEAFYEAMWNTINSTGSWQGEIWDRRKNGEIYPKWLTITAVIGSDGEISHYVGTHIDISERKATEEYINHLAFYDALTQLPNRRLLQERIKQGININCRMDTQMAVLMLDLDKFKAVNDTLGHAAGDELLQQVARRIQCNLRQVDMVARLGGDEFVIVLENVGHYEYVARIAESIIHSLSQPFILCQSQAVYIGVSIGIAIHPQHGDSEETLMDNADAALYHAKDNGRGCFAYFSEELTRKARERLALESRLRRAIEQQEFHIYFQPQIDINSGLIIGAEALVRWHDPIYGIITPNEFISLAEDTGLIIPLGEWILRETCRLGRQWLDQGLPPLMLAVNVSPYQFSRSDINALVTQVLRDTGFPVEYLELEITESGLMENQQHALSILKNLHHQGVHLAIDDFGTGYSSLAYLKYFPVDVLKIDKTFIDDIPYLEGDMVITATIISMAHHLGFKVLAEGVETVEQLAFLREQGCDNYQGYLYSEAMPADDFAKLLADSSM
jgi:diguanylate cyclase (GGDEF)-like protein/PAS domain S-box-containing protein